MPLGTLRCMMQRLPRLFLLLALLVPAFCGLLRAQLPTHGQMVGEVTATGAVYWTRASIPALVSVQYSTDPTLANFAETPQQAALVSRDLTVRIELSGLQPATRYYYRARLTNQPGPLGNFGVVGTFRTAPQSGQDLPVSIAFSGDANDLGQFGVFPTILADAPDLFLNLGDFPYCDGATTLADYWAEHRAIRDSAALHMLCDQVPWVAIWDDHEVVNNWDAQTSTTLVGNGTQAFRDWFPLPDGPLEAYRRLRHGAGVELFVLDTRRYRDLNNALPAPQKTLLGATQRAWLEQALLQSTAKWKVVATSVPTFYGGTDSWDGYVHERESLLQFLVDHDLHNVVFVAADQHIAAIRELRSGLLEVQAGPLAQFVGSNTHRREPEQRWHGTVRNFGVIDYDPSTTPSTLRIRFHDASGAILREHVATEIVAPARLAVHSDVPEAGFVLADGPHLVRDDGTRATRERLHPGSYHLHARDLAHGDTPASFEIDVPQGADVRIATSYEDLPGPHPVLFEEHFDQPFGAPWGWTLVDLGTSGPSAWLVVDRQLSQRSNIGGSAPAYAGSLAIAGQATWTDVTLQARFYSRDNDSCGVVFRYRGPGDYYRARFDAERQVTQLTRFVSGQPTVLAERSNEPGYAQTFWHDVTVTAIADRLRVWRNGELLFDVVDATHPDGRIGLYTWADQLVSFDDVVVRAGDATTRSRQQLFEHDFASGSLAPMTVVDVGTVSGPSQWSVQNGEAVQTSNIEDGDGSRAGLPKAGTLLLAPTFAIDQEVRVRLRNDDNDAIGVVFRYQDVDNHYRFSLDAQRHYRRLVKVAQGQWTTLWESDDDYPPSVWHQVSVAARGDTLRVGFDGLTLCEVEDGSLSIGRAGVYCWASTGARFDDFLMQVPPAPRAVTAAVATPGQERIELCAPASAGRLYLLALSAATTPGIPLATLQPGDLRTWRLNDDPFFQFSLQPSSILAGFQGTLGADGRATAVLTWPPVASQLLGGGTLFCGGITYDPNQGTWGELFPTLPLTIPR